MIKKILKNAKNRVSKGRLKHSKNEIINFCKKNVAISILIAVAILFIATGSPFVTGALLGGYIATKQSEKLVQTSSSLLILTTSIGAILGGITLMVSVVIGRFFHPIGSILGLFVGGTTVIAFLGDLTEKMARKLQDLSFINNTYRKVKRKKSKARKKTNMSKRKFHLKTT